MPEGTKVLEAEAWGTSAWSKTAKITTLLLDGTPKRYFVKCTTGKLAKIHMWGEAYSAGIIAEAAPDLGSHPVGRGDYFDDANNHVYFYLQNYHDMDVQSPSGPAALAYAIAELHRNAVSPNGMWGYPIVTGRGMVDREEHWDKSWAAQFTHLLQDLMTLDTLTNGH